MNPQLEGIAKSAARTVARALGLRIVPQGRIDKGEMFVVHEAGLPTQLERRHLRRFLDEFGIDCIFDVGANRGQYVHMVRQLGFMGPIISFEPLPELAEEMRRAAALEDNWYIEQLALDSEARNTVFNMMAGDQFSSLSEPAAEDPSIFDTMNVVTRTIPVRTERLDHIFSRYQEKLGFRRPYLKMDTQGNDVAVARGAGRFLAQFVGLQSELSFKPIYAMQADYGEAIRFYEESGFVLSAIVPNNAGHFPDLYEADCIMYNRELRPAGI